jgi:glycerophosphoryl diester phosphodiesterase
LYDALHQGFTSIEADPWLVDGELLVAHDANQIKLNHTLEAMYLAPLAEIVTENGGRVYPAGKYSGAGGIILLIDHKGGATADGQVNKSVTAVEQYDALEMLLQGYQEEYPGLFTEWYGNGSLSLGAINIYVSGNRPDPAYVAQKPYRLSALDGRLSNLDNQYGPDVYPLISNQWCCDPQSALVPGPVKQNISTYNLTDTQRSYVENFIAETHDQGRIIRFYGVEPDTPVVWQLMFDLGVDLVNTDNLLGLRNFIFDKISTAGGAVPATDMGPYFVASAK